MKLDFSALTGGDTADRQRLASTLLLLLAANLAAWLWAWQAFAHHPALLAMALLAYMLGLRHAVDADHIAAIDNTVRKLMQDRQRPFAVGLYFSLGHSSVVLLVVAIIVFATSHLQQQVAGFRALGGMIGTCVSAAFLLGLAALNLAALRGIWQHFRRARAGHAVCDEELNLLLGNRGLLARMLRPLFRMVSRSWHMYPVGFLFGLGFDTATEVGLFAMAGAQAAQGIPLWNIMVFPVLFAVGMALIDTLDSLMMVGVYGWAFVNPIRKLWYNLTITLVSVLVALLIGGLEALGLLAEKLQLSGWFWDGVASLNADLANFGYLVIGIFFLTWALSAAVYKWQRLGELESGVA